MDSLTKMASKFSIVRKYVDMQAMVAANLPQLKNDIAEAFTTTTTDELQELEADTSMK